MRRPRACARAWVLSFGMLGAASALTAAGRWLTRRLDAFAAPALSAVPRGVDLRLERFSELVGVSHPDP
jgi:hypothetical protein